MSRQVLLQWINERSDHQYTKIEDLCCGTTYCDIFDQYFPGEIDMTRLKRFTKQDQEKAQNFQLLQEAITKNQVRKRIIIDRIILGRFQDNLEFVQWFKKTFEGMRPAQPIQRGQTQSSSSSLSSTTTSSSVLSSVPSASSSNSSSNQIQSPLPVQPTPTHKRSTSREDLRRTKTDSTPSTPSRSKSIHHQAGKSRVAIRPPVSQLIEEKNLLQQRLDEALEEVRYYYEKLVIVEQYCEKNDDNPIIANLLDILHEQIDLEEDPEAYSPSDDEMF